MKKKGESGQPKESSADKQLFNLEWVDSAEKYYFHLPEKDQKRILKALEDVVQNPFWGKHTKRLHGEFEGLFRYRVGSLRLIYRIIPEKRIVRIIAFGTRGDIYK